MTRQKRAACLAAMGGLMALAPMVMAAPPQLRSEGGLLVLPNVRVENAARPVEQPADAAPSGAGMRAYRDADSGRLRKPTPEDLKADAQVSPAASVAPANARFTQRAGVHRSAQLDESYMSYSVASKAADGTLDLQCVTGERQARQALVGNFAKKGQRHAQ